MSTYFRENRMSVEIHAVSIVLLTALMIMLVLAFGTERAHAADVVDSGTTGDLTWTYDSDGVLTISGEGAMGNSSETGQPWRSHIDDVTSVVIEEGCTHIGNWSFAYMDNMSSIVIPEGVRTVGQGAFLRNNAVQEVTLPSSVNSIGHSCFQTCENLTSVTCQGILAEIPNSTFYNCRKLAQFDIPESVTRIGTNSFRGTAITSVRIPAGVKTIEESAFRFCYSLESVEFSEGLETIDFYAFNGCTSLTKIELPGTVKKLRTDCFGGCTNLKDVTLNDGLQELESQVFHGCNYLHNLYLPSSVTSFEQNCFGDQAIHVWREGDSPAITQSNVIVHNGITRSAYEFFSAGSINYGYVQIPDEITNIPSNAMPDYADIIELAIPSTVESFAADALSQSNWKRIKKVYYEGTEEEFAALGLGDVLSHAEIVYDVNLSDFKNVADLTIIYDEGPYTYNGEAFEPEVTVKDGDTVLTEGQDYDLTYSNNTNAGTADIVIKAKGTGYYGEVQKQFEIERMTDLSEIVISEIPDQEYTGRLVEPQVTASLKGINLTPGYDYVFSFADNIDEGQATVYILFVGGNILGSEMRHFNIIKTDTPGQNYGYKVEITAAGETETTYHLVGEAVTVNAPDKAGYKFLNWTAEGPAASFFGDADLTSSELSFDMPTMDLALTAEYEKSIEAVELEGFKDQLVYNGKARKQAMDVVWNGTKLTEGTDYTIAYENNKAVGTATVTITASGDFKGTLTKTYQIIPKGTKMYKFRKGKGSFTVRWKKIKTKMNKTRITGYQIEYATDKEFTQDVQSIDVKGYKKKSKKIRNLIPKTRYYVHVRTFKTIGEETYYSNWTKVKYVKTK